MKTKKSPAACYSDYAHKWAERMQSGKNIAHDFLEKPAMYKKLPGLNGKAVLCVGCGTGEECVSLKARGARRVVGVDIAKGMIDVAKQNAPELEFHAASMEKFDFPDNTFDLVYSSLAMHYLKKWDKALANIFRVLKPGGTFLFSTHHPTRWCMQSDITAAGESTLLGHVETADGTKIYGDYFTTRLIHDTWFDGDFDITYYHRPLGDIIKDIVNSGFTIADIAEPKPLKSALKACPSFYERNSKIPVFMIFELRKP